MHLHSSAATALLRDVAVLPVLTIERLEEAVPLARSLVAGGLGVLEVTLRTEASLAALAAIRAALPGAVVGAGSVLEPAQLREAQQAGAMFAVSPGATRALIDAALAGALPFIAGVQTASEALECRERGLRLLKWFPAQAAGGCAFLRALGGPLQDLRFCPTGGIDAALAREYLALPNVACVGGSWMCPPELVRAGTWAEITARAATAAALR